MNECCGEFPSAIGINPYIHRIYIANQGSNTIYVIDTQANSTYMIDNITAGRHPSAIDIDVDTNTIYVANAFDNSVSVIDGEYMLDKVVAKVMFNIKPLTAGHIECDGTPVGLPTVIAPIGQQLYISSGSKCIAKPTNQGFEFDSWQENLTQIVPASSSPFWTTFYTNSPGFVKSILDYILPYLQIDKPEATLKITKFGNFTANFKVLPPIPTEYVATLIGVVATAFVGTWLTPALIGWRESRTQRKYFKECISQIGKLDKNTLEDKFIGYYADGKLSDVQHQLLNDKISDSL